MFRQLSEEFDVKWVEYWDFLGCYCNLKKTDGLVKLEYYLLQKKFETMLTNQHKTCEMIKQELNLDESEELSIKLGEIREQIRMLKVELGLIEYCLSEKFEKVQLIKESLISYKEKKLKEVFLNPNTLSNLNNHEEFLRKPELDLKIEGLKTRIEAYFNAIIEAINADRSAIVYFYLYKSAKQIISLLNYKDFVDDIYLTSYFKHLDFKLKNSQEGIKQSPNEDVLKHALKSLKLDDKTKIDIDAICEKISQISFNEETNGEDEELEIIIRKQNLKDKYYNVDTRKTTIVDTGYESNNEEKSSDEEDVQKKKMWKSENISKYIDRDKYKKVKIPHSLFIFGYVCIILHFNVLNVNFKKKTSLRNTPSKIDFAVYLAIKEASNDIKKFPTLNQWFNFMKKYKISDMKRFVR